MGELSGANYPIGRRVLGSFGYVGRAAEVKATITPREAYTLPPALIQRAELVTKVSTAGEAQSVVRYDLLTKATLLEIRLPAGSDAVVDLSRRPADEAAARGRKPAAQPAGAAEADGSQAANCVRIAESRSWDCQARSKPSRRCFWFARRGPTPSGRFRRPTWSGNCCCRRVMSCGGRRAPWKRTRLSARSGRP